MLKTFLIAWKSVQEKLADYFRKYHSEKHHKHVRPIYPKTNKTPRSVPPVLVNLDLQGFVDPSDSKMEELCKMFPIPHIEQLRRNVARKQTTDKQNTERHRT